MIVNRLPDIMNQKGVSIRELSRTTGITYTTIRGVYHGERRSVQLDVLDAICQTLNVQPGDIYKYAPEGAEYVQPPAEPAGKQSGKGSSRKRQAKADRPKGQVKGWKNW